MDIYDTRDARSLPGFIMHPDGLGFEYLAADGKRISMRGVAPSDRLFRSAKFGLLNISKAIAKIQESGQAPRLATIDQRLIDHIKLVDMDLKYVFEMSKKQSNEPIIMVIASDGVNVIDGHHRLQRRIFDKRTNVKVHLLVPETVRYMQVQVFKENAEGQMVLEVGMTDAQLTAEIEAGQRTAELLVRMNA